MDWKNRRMTTVHLHRAGQYGTSSSETVHMQDLSDTVSHSRCEDISVSWPRACQTYQPTSGSVYTMDSAGLARVVCLAIASWSIIASSSAPNPPATAEEQDKYRKEYKKSDVMLVSVPATIMVFRVRVSSSSNQVLESCLTRSVS